MKVPLTSGAYEARNLIANAQRCVNLYAEINPEDAPFPTTHYPRPGLKTWSAPPVSGAGRGMYLATNGELYVAVGAYLYWVSLAKEWTPVATLGTSTGMVGMVDNGTVLCLVDGTSAGYAVDLATHDSTVIQTDAFYGSRHVSYIDTYLTFARPDSNQFYITTSNLDFAASDSGTINTGHISVAGAGYIDGTYPNVSLTGGSGTGATATFKVSGGAITSVTLTNTGSGYKSGDVLGCALAFGGAATSLTISNPGVYLTDGAYTARATTGGNGTGLTVDVTVVDGAATLGTVNAGGTGYAVGDYFKTTNVPTSPPPPIGGEPAEKPIQPTFKVSAISSSSTAFEYTVDTITANNAFDALDIAAKTGFPDKIVGHCAVHRELWLFGERTTEVWNNTGAADFTFGLLQGVFIQHGCIAPYSICSADLQTFWLGNDPQGRAIVFSGISYNAKRISTHAIEREIQGYGDVSDAVGMIYQQEGHLFYQLTFPTADKTWVYDSATNFWHERTWTDSEGVQHRDRCIAYANAYKMDLMQDWETGKVYQSLTSAYDDDGSPVVYVRSWPHLKNDGSRISFSSFIADMGVGTSEGTMIGTMEPSASLRWSDDGGRSWSNPVMQSFGASGEYKTSMQWNRLGMGRDRVFELSWSTNNETALNGAYIRAISSAS